MFINYHLMEIHICYFHAVLTSILYNSIKLISDQLCTFSITSIDFLSQLVYVYSFYNVYQVLTMCISGAIFQSCMDVALACKSTV